MADKDENLVDKLKEELASLEKEEEMLRKRDDQLKEEEEILQKERGLGEDSNVVEADIQTISSITLDAATTYLLLEETPKRSIELFLKEKKAGLSGLLITRSNPRKMRDKFDMEGVKICWLTGVRAGEKETTIAGLQELSILVSNYVDKNSKSIVLLDGLEYLVSNNDFPIVLRLIQQIRDKVSTSESKMIIPLNPNALDGKQLTLLKRECQVIN